MLGLRNEFANFNRSADAKLELLREIIDRLGKGEKVDVEKLLGAGDEAREKEWEEGKWLSAPTTWDPQDLTPYTVYSSPRNRK